MLANPELDWFAVGVATVAGFLLGGIWYAPPVFGNLWIRVHGQDPALVKRTATSVLIPLVSTFATAFFLAIVVGWTGSHSLLEGLLVGGVIALGFIVAIEVPHGVFEGNWPKFFVGAAHQTLLVLIMACILAAWP